ncbi:hypothetical protein, partial [Campylobacter sp.]|uniref:hypothetical protein n=1 Tax=Campylobacter sp. TaxID=205 RepID=UPI0027B9D0A0
DASVDMRLFSEGGRNEIKRELDQVLDDLDDIRLSIKDKFETNKLTEEQKRIVETQSAKDALTILLRQSGVKEETINEIVNSPTIKNFAYIADKLNSKAVSSGDLSTDQNPEISYTKNGIPSINLGTVHVDGSESMLNVYGLATKGADAAAFIIEKVGHTAATLSVAAIQTMVSGPTKTIAGIATDNISDRFTRPIKQAISDKTRKYLTEDEDEAYIAENQRGINIVSDSVGEVAVGAIFGGINRFIKSLTKLSKANKDLINNNKLENVEKKWEGGNSNNKDLSLDANSKVEDKIKSTTKTDKTVTSEVDKVSTGYKPPKGGGGVSNRITINNQEYTFGHGGRHVEEWGLNHLDVEKAIADKMSGLKNIAWSKNALYKDYIIVDGVKIEFHAKKLPNGKINIGTYFGPEKKIP